LFINLTKGIKMQQFNKNIKDKFFAVITKEHINGNGYFQLCADYNAAINYATEDLKNFPDRTFYIVESICKLTAVQTKLSIIKTNLKTSTKGTK